MGEVYRARDTRLGREVAVKVLREDIACSNDWRRRFGREAQAISRLAHPHVCALFDVGKHGEVDYLVMELLSGETLARRLEKGPLPFEQVLLLGAQIASALAAAHAAGVTHGDLKPGNVMITSTGVMLLDFGLARTLTPKGEHVPSDSTASFAVRHEGEVSGTAAYMAPERLEGNPGDTRTDMFALGAVLFEMATGKKAFAGDSRASIISAVMTTEPPAVSSVQRRFTPAFDQLVGTCLEKKPDARWNSAHDVELLLHQIERSPQFAPIEPSPIRHLVRWAPWAVALVGLVALCAALWLRRSGEDPRSARPVRFSLAPPPGGAFVGSPEEDTLAVSPDGSQIAFVAWTPQGSKRLWLRRLTDTDSHALAGSEEATSVFWSPDSQSVGFFAEGMLKRIDLPAGAAVTICRNDSSSGQAATWGKNGDILFGPTQDGIMHVSASGGEPTLALRRDRAGGEYVRWPWFLPDGRRFLYFRRQGPSHTLMLSIPGEQPREVMPVGSKAQFSEPGFLVFAREGSLLAQRFDRNDGRVTGAPFAIAQRVQSFLTTGAADFATSTSGTLVWQSADDAQRIVMLDRNGREIGVPGRSGKYLDVEISPTGASVAYSRATPGIGTFDVWSLDLARGVETRVTSGPGNEMHPVWLPEETGIVYSDQPDRVPHLVRRSFDSGSDSLLVPVGRWQSADDVSPDGRTLLYTEWGDKGTLWTVPVIGGEPSRVLPSGTDGHGGRFSPDGRYITFISDESGSSEAYVARYPSPGGRTRISSGGALLVRWVRGTGEIFYSSPNGQLWLVTARTQPELHLGAPTSVFMANGQAFDVFPDGKRFLVLVPEVKAESLPKTVLLNWPAATPH